MRFRLETLLLSTLVLATSMAMLGAVPGAVLGVMSLGLVAAIYHPATRWRGILTLPVLMMSHLGLLGALATQAAREREDASRCSSQMRQLAQGMRDFHDAFQFLPTEYLTDEKGRPLHSWRAVLMPYIEHSALYRRYSFREPWNGPSNRRMRAVIGYPYRCPSDTDERPTSTSYVAVVGPGTAWPQEGVCKFGDIRDGMGNTILLIELADSGIHWMEPRDVTLDEVLAGIRNSGLKGGGIATPHGDVAGIRNSRIGFIHVLMADGTVREIPRDISPKTLRALFTIDGGETIDWTSPEFDLRRPIPYWWAPGAAMIGSYVLLIGRLRAWKRRNASSSTNASDPPSHSGPRTTDQEPKTDN